MKVIKFFVLCIVVLLMLLATVAASPVHAQDSPGVGVAEAQIGRVAMQSDATLSEILDLTSFIKTAAVGAVPLIFVIVGLVSFAKKLGAKGNGLTVISMIIGLILGGGYMLTQQRPPVMTDWFPVFVFWFGVAVYALAMGLVASGVYDVAKGMIEKLLGAIKPPA